jgi:ectoine hydroxylase-related dioxygenase (phytanoyl-CoA dioxygenase family)
MKHYDVLNWIPKYLHPSPSEALNGLTDQERKVSEDLRCNGYSIIDFPESNFEHISNQIIKDLTPLFDIFGWIENKVGSLRIQDAQNIFVRNLLKNQEVVNLLSNVFGRKAFPFQSLNFPVGTQQHPHSDDVHFSSLPKGFMCGCWIALEDITEDAGPLIYYPRSHLLPDIENHLINIDTNMIKAKYGLINQIAYEEIWDELLSAAGLTPQFFTCKKGQAVIWAHSLIHGGSKHQNKFKTRWSQVNHYFFKGCSYFTPMLSDMHLNNIVYRDIYDFSTMQPVENQYKDKLDIYKISNQKYHDNYLKKIFKFLKR